MSKEHSPLIPWGLWKDILPATSVFSIVARGVKAVSVCVFVLCAQDVCPYFKLIHPLAVIQGSESACWLIDRRKPVILNSREEAEEEQTSPSFLSPSPLFRDTAVVQSSFPWELSFISEEWFEPGLSQLHFCLSSLGQLIWQKQKKSIYPRGRRGQGRRNMCEAKLPHCGWGYKTAWPFLGAVWKFGSEALKWTYPLTQQLHF